MSLIPTLGQALSELLDRPAAEMEMLVRAALHEATDRLQRQADPSTHANIVEALRRRLSQPSPYFDALEIRNMPIDQLPMVARLARDELQHSLDEWEPAWKAYQAALATQVSHLRQSGADADLARLEADNEPDILVLKQASLEKHKRRKAVEAIVKHCEEEMLARDIARRSDWAT